MDIEKKDDNRIPLYFLNNFIKFERKLYQFANIPLGRPIQLKTAIYFLVTVAVLAIMYITPVINVLVRWMQPAMLLMVAVGISWVMTDIGTEDRTPLKFFKAFLQYNYQKLKGGYLYRNSKITKLKTYSFGNQLTYVTTDYSTEIGVMKLNDVNKSGMGQPSVIADRDKSNQLENNSKEFELVPVSQSNDLANYLFGNESDNIQSEQSLEHETIESIPKVDEEIVDTEIEKDNIVPINEVNVPEHNDENIMVDKKQRKENAKGKKRMNLTPKKKKLYTLVASITGSLIALGLVLFVTLDFIESKENSPNAQSNEAEVGNEVSSKEHEENLIKGIKQASIQNYAEAVIYFDKINFNSLEKEDKEIVLLSYLFTDQVGKILDLDSEFDEVVTSYYVAKEDISKLRQYEERSDEFQFVIAVEDKEYQTIVDLKDKVSVDEEREIVIANAYLELDRAEEAFDYAKTTDNQNLIDTIEKRLNSNKDKAKENDDE